jgi:transcriptional regulator with XRE-family HTH domain
MRAMDVCAGRTLRMNFGKRLYFLRDRRKLSQEKLAELLEYSTGSERRLEKGRGGASFAMLAKLAQVFKIEVIDLFQFDESIPQEKTTEALDEETLRLLFGDRLRFLRNIRQRTQSEVARGTRKTERFIRSLEKGEEGASFNTLAKLADFLDVDVKEFFRFGKSFPQDRQSDPGNPQEASSPS